MIATFDQLLADRIVLAQQRRPRHHLRRWHRTAEGVRFTAASIIARCRGAR